MSEVTLTNLEDVHDEVLSHISAGTIAKFHNRVQDNTKSRTLGGSRRICHRLKHSCADFEYVSQSEVRTGNEA